MPRIAFHTFGILREQREHPRNQNYMDLSPDVFASADQTDGFLLRISREDKRMGPRFFRPGEHPDTPQTLSVWVDLESVFAFSYHGLHAHALRHRKEWFVKPQWPTYVAWWIPDNHIPTYQEAYVRLEFLHDHGPTAYAFDFKRPFDAAGRPTQLIRQRINEKIPTVR